MQNHSGGDSVAIGIWSPSSPHLHTPFPPFSLSVISLMVSVDVKHQVYQHFTQHDPAKSLPIHTTVAPDRVLLAPDPDQRFTW